VFEEVDPGGTVSFECQVRAFPPPIVKWYKDDTEMGFVEGDVTARVRADDSFGTGSTIESTGGDRVLRLVIRDAKKDDEGAYRCKAENDEGVAATTGYLSVTGAPSTSGGSNSQLQQQQQQQQLSSSPRASAVSTPPLLRAITEQQSMEEREAAEYHLLQQSHLANNDESNDDDQQLTAAGALLDDTSSPDWSYVEYLKAAGIDMYDVSVPEKMSSTAAGDSGSDTSIEADNEDLSAVVALSSTEQFSPVRAAGEEGLGGQDGRTEEQLVGEQLRTSVNAGGVAEEVEAATVVPPVAVNVYVCDDVGGPRQKDASSDAETAGDRTRMLLVDVSLPPSRDHEGDVTASSNASTAADGRGFGFGPFDKRELEAGGDNSSLRSLNPATTSLDSVRAVMQVLGGGRGGRIGGSEAVVDHQPSLHQQSPPFVSPDAVVTASTVQPVYQSFIVDVATPKKESEITGVAASPDEPLASQPDKSLPLADDDSVFASSSTPSNNVVIDSLSPLARLNRLLPLSPGEHIEGPACAFVDTEKDTKDNVLSELATTVPVKFPEDLAAVVDVYLSWFERPWITYVILAVVGTLLALSYEADPAILVLGVASLSLICFLVFPPITSQG
jgi:hypothetical protein